MLGWDCHFPADVKDHAPQDVTLGLVLLYHKTAPCGVANFAEVARMRWGCFGGMRSDGVKDGSDPISTRRHFAERLDGTGKM